MCRMITWDIGVPANENLGSEKMTENKGIKTFKVFNSTRTSLRCKIDLSHVQGDNSIRIILQREIRMNKGISL